MEEVKRETSNVKREEENFTEAQEEAIENTEEESLEVKEEKEREEHLQYVQKGKDRFYESEKLDEKRALIPWEKQIEFQRRNEGFMKVSYIGPDAKTGQPKMMFLYGYGSLQSSVLFLHAVYSTGYIPVGYHTFDLKNGYSVEWYSRARYFDEAAKIEKDIEYYQSEEAKAEKTKRENELKEAGYKAWEQKALELKAEQYEELESNKLVKFLKFIRFIK